MISVVHSHPLLTVVLKVAEKNKTILHNPDRASTVDTLV